MLDAGAFKGRGMEGDKRAQPEGAGNGRRVPLSCWWRANMPASMPPLLIMPNCSENEVYLLEEVFKKSGLPTHTFVAPKEFNRLVVALRTPGKGIVVEGPSGIGKTSSIRRALERVPLPNSRLLSARREEDRAEIRAICEHIDNIGLVIVDDFHRLPHDLQERLGDAIKVLSDEENSTSKLVLVGINRAGQSLIDHSPDLLHRVETIKFGRTNIERIVELIEKGEHALNCVFTNKHEISEESEGSFAMAQVLCHEACLQADLIETAPEHRGISISVPAIREAVLRELSSGFTPVARDFATGNKLRREGRAPYLHLLKWLSATPEGDLDTREAIAANPSLKGSVSQVIEKGHLKTLLASEPRIGEYIHFDERSQLLTTEDPKFLYFIRHMVWSKFSRQVGYDSLEFAGRYDYALSFAGADRELAAALARRLEEREIAVFYDENEAARILGTDVEEYLAPIYRTEATYILPLISDSYPNRIWTKFESDQFKQRFGQDSVIPILVNGFTPTQFDPTSRTGFLVMRSDDIEGELDRIINLLGGKIIDGRQSAIKPADPDANQTV